MTAAPDLYTFLPKVDLHRHLEGSLRLTTMLEIARAYNLAVPMERTRLSSLVQFQKRDQPTYQNFLAKFATLRLLYRSPEVIQRITSEAIEDAARDNVRHLEMRFTPVALSRVGGFPLGKVMDWVCAAARQAAEEHRISVRLIVSVNRHESVQLAEEVVALAMDRLPQGVVGMDLAGNEADFPAEPFASILHAARQAGLRLTIHAGEWNGAANVRQAIEEFGAERIGHGVRVLEDPNTVALARERQTVFEVCLTSNYQSGVTPRLRDHPVRRMLDAGLKVSLGSDDPSVSQITLSQEYRLARKIVGLSLEALKEIILVGAQAAFLPPSESKTLQNRVETELKRVLEASQSDKKTDTIKP